MNHLDDETSRLLPALREETFKLLASFTIPIYRTENESPNAFGSGFFVKHAEQYFFVSAAHVLERLRTEPLSFFATREERIPLSGQVFLTPWTGDRESDPIDIGIVKFNSDRLPPYPDVKKYAMDISYLKPRLLPRQNKQYVFIGYPASQSKVDRPKRTVTSNIYSYDSSSISDDLYKTHSVSNESHLILPLDLRRGYDMSGKHRNFPKPQGMSGSPIWVHYDDNDNATQHRVFPVVAIGTKYKKGVGIVATDIGFAIDLIKQVAG